MWDQISQWSIWTAHGQCRCDRAQVLNHQNWTTVPKVASQEKTASLTIVLAKIIAHRKVHFLYTDNPKPVAQIEATAKVSHFIPRPKALFECLRIEGNDRRDPKKTSLNSVPELSGESNFPPLHELRVGKPKCLMFAGELISLSSILPFPDKAV